jgi:hypothetical protein
MRGDNAGASAHLSDDETVAKMGHSGLGIWATRPLGFVDDLDLGLPLSTLISLVSYRLRV